LDSLSLNDHLRYKLAPELVQIMLQIEKVLTPFDLFVASSARRDFSQVFFFAKRGFEFILFDFKMQNYS
jgi:hypothetical protein